MTTKSDFPLLVIAENYQGVLNTIKEGIPYDGDILSITALRYSSDHIKISKV